MKKISAEIVADSVNLYGDRITTMLLTYPRFIHGELLTHRVFSKNSASSRAIPFEKMVKMVEEDPFIPIAWQKDHRGMQGNEYMLEDDVFSNIKEWLQARDYSIKQATYLYERGVTKQLCNRLLEPFMWHTVLLTGTEFENFFKLRCPLYQTPVSQTVEPQYSWKDLEEVHSNPINLELLENNRDDYTFKLQHNKGQAEIHMMALAEAMWDAMNESIPKELKAGEWHIPFGDRIDLISWLDIVNDDGHLDGDLDEQDRLFIIDKLKISTARCARLSYMTFDGEIDYEKDLKLHDTLLESHHMSPFEHCARAMSDEEYYSFVRGRLPQGHEVIEFLEEKIEDYPDRNIKYGWCNNFKGFIQYRYLIEN